jgi:hypothetical protein
MKNNVARACEKTGFVLRHATVCQQVADRVNCIILFREPGAMAQGLIDEGYCMKGFRIDTKSCNWGPMSGFVCADPRLTKDPSYIDRNATWTGEALSGHIVEKFFGKVEDATWVADVMPIAISQARIDELHRKSVIHPQKEQNDYVGESRATKGDTMLYWRLVPIGNASQPWLKDRGNALRGYYLLCVNTGGAKPFQQIYPKGVAPIKFRGHEAVLGLINPGTKQRGFKACVTADYDLFAIWEGKGKEDRLALQHNLNAALLSRAGTPQEPLPQGVARMAGVDDRLQSAGHREHHRFGDVSTRVMHVKTFLNTALQGAAGYPGGNAIHHNDEAGNFALAKGTLNDCLPLIGFLPSTASAGNPLKQDVVSLGMPARTVLIEDLSDFKELALYAREKGYNVRAKQDWLAAAGVPA